MANIIYLDQPVGTGFSYSRNPFADIPSDTGSVKRVNEFVRKVKAKTQSICLSALTFGDFVIIVGDLLCSG